MADLQDNDVPMAEDDYDEEADSDFDAASIRSGGSDSSSEDQGDADTQATKRSKKRRKVEGTVPTEGTIELDSGDEATLKEHKKDRRRRKKKGEHVEEDDANQTEGWKARTRAMREREQEERKQNKLATVNGSTVDVNKLWEEMNRPGPLPSITTAPLDTDELRQSAPEDTVPSKETVPTHEADMVTIKRTYKFAGETHTEEKSVPKDSAEAKLWLAQQSNKGPAYDADGKIIHRPMRKVSRFDPNHSNLEAFKGNWSLTQKDATGPKLNVVEKSKMDWAVHVDAEGLQEELSEHAKAKDSYLSRDDFLRSVSQRKDDAAREARLRGR